ncbi:MAG: hypothetical protein RJB10_2061 [Pseudomonadota bacterium]|jgi:hypothetical protein
MNVIPISKESLLTALKELDFLVVSLDHIFHAELSTEAMSDTVSSFVIEGDVFRRLASIRQMLDTTLAENISKAESDTLEDARDSSCRPWDYSLPHDYRSMD